MSDRSLAELQAQQRAWLDERTGPRPFWLPLLGAVREVGKLAALSVTKPELRAALSVDPRLRPIQSMLAGLGGVSEISGGVMAMAVADPVEGAANLQAVMGSIGHGFGVMAKMIAPANVVPRDCLRPLFDSAETLQADPDVAQVMATAVLFLMDVATMVGVDLQAALEALVDVQYSTGEEPGWEEDREALVGCLRLAGVGPQGYDREYDLGLLRVVSGWTDEQCQQAGDWAAATHLEASDNDVTVPAEPAHVAELQWTPEVSALVGGLEGTRELMRQGQPLPTILAVFDAQRDVTQVRLPAAPGWLRLSIESMDSPGVSHQAFLGACLSTLLAGGAWWFEAEASLYIPWTEHRCLAVYRAGQALAKQKIEVVRS